MDYIDMGIDWVMEKQRTPYIVSGKSIETRMRVVCEQLVKDMVNDTDMDQIKKMVAMKYIHKMRQRMLLIASKRNASYETIAQFRNCIAKANLKLHFKYAPEKVHGYKGMIWA